MHQGRFERPAAGSYRRGTWPEDSLEPPRLPTTTRRGFLLSALGVLSFGAGIGFAAGWLSGRRSVEAGSGAPERHAATGAVGGLPDWAQEMLRVDAETLLQRAGDYERLSRRELDHDLSPCFERLLDVASAASPHIGDSASACALRTLGKLGRHDLVDAWAARGLAFPESQAEVQAIVEERRWSRARAATRPAASPREVGAR